MSGDRLDAGRRRANVVGDRALQEYVSVQARRRRLQQGLVAAVLLTFATPSFAQPPPPLAWADEERAGTADRAAAPPRLAPDAESPIRPYWSDADEMAYTVAVGTVGICQAFARPLLLAPGFGPALYLAAEWACLVPGAVSVDYMQTFHGGRELLLWESASALVAAKILRDVTRLPVVVTFGSSALASVVIAAAMAASGGLQFLPARVPDQYQPLALTGILTSQALLITIMDALREVATFYAYHGTLGLLSDVTEDREAQIEVQREAWMPRDLNALTRFWALASVAGGSKPRFSLLHLIPVFGRVLWAFEASEALRERMRKVSRDTLREKRQDFELMDAAIGTLYAVDAGVAIVTDLVLMSSVAIWGVGTTAFLLAPSFGVSEERQGQVLGTLGAAGVALASTAVFLVVVKDVKGVIGPWLIPLAYGPLPPGMLEALFEQGASDDDPGEVETDASEKW